jgi:hypothetical protein
VKDKEYKKDVRCVNEMEEKVVEHLESRKAATVSSRIVAFGNPRKKRNPNRKNVAPRI